MSGAEEVRGVVELSPEWAAECIRWRGRVLTGRFAHWCHDWDLLPVDETTPNEFDCCHCYGEDQRLAQPAAGGDGDGR